VGTGNDWQREFLAPKRQQWRSVRLPGEGQPPAGRTTPTTARAHSAQRGQVAAPARKWPTEHEAIIGPAAVAVRRRAGLCRRHPLPYARRMFGMRSRVVKVRYPMPTFVAVHIQVQAHDLIEAGKPTRALLLLKRRAQLNWPEAIDAAAILKSGQVLPDWPQLDETDLATRARDLRDAGRRKAAIFTVRAERNELSYDDAAAYVDSA
jgi:hypothetical protein